jgi:multidrug transporter EmrE-like cation transporter
MAWLLVIVAGLFETVKLVSIGVILAGVIGLNLSGVTPP